jgi:hypothetical protein
MEPYSENVTVELSSKRMLLRVYERNFFFSYVYYLLELIDLGQFFHNIVTPLYLPALHDEGYR